MFTCSHCGTEFLEHKSNCPNCGAAIKVNSAPASVAKSVRTDLYEICDAYQENRCLYFDDTINAMRRKNATAYLNVPAHEKVIMIYDDTILNNSNKVGFAICPDGLYWKNDWSVDTKRTYLSWTELSKREIKLDGLHVNLGKGDRIGTAGCGSDEIRVNIVKLLQEIQLAYR